MAQHKDFTEVQSILEIINEFVIGCLKDAVAIWINEAMKKNLHDQNEKVFKPCGYFIHFQEANYPRIIIISFF